MTLVVVPAALLTLLLAYSLFNAALNNLRTTQAGAARGKASTISAWIDASGRTLADEAADAALLGRDHCLRLASAFLERNKGFASVRFYDENQKPCEKGAPLGVAPSAQIAADAGGYGLAAADGRLWILAAEPSRPCALVIDGALLRERLTLAAAEGETHLALIWRDGEALALDPASPDFDWRPAQLPAAPSAIAFRAADRAGGAVAFALAPAGSGLSVLMRFDDRLYDAEWRRFLLLCVAQLAMLGLTAYVFARAVRRDVVRWIEGIDVAARAHEGDPERRAPAPVSAEMPRELRNFAVSFNAIADQAASREKALKVSLGDNRALMLEMHHRIKNSLQVIQSYLALIRRNGPRAEAALTARIEARIGVLATAYRLGMSPGGMRPIDVRAFLEEIFAAASAGLRRPQQRATCAIAWDGPLILDRAIPLGLALAEALIAVFAAAEVSEIAVSLTPTPQGAVELCVEADASPSASGLPEKVMLGLAAQLGASPAQVSPGHILHWRFDP